MTGNLREVATSLALLFLGLQAALLLGLVALDWWQEARWNRELRQRAKRSAGRVTITYPED